MRLKTRGTFTMVKMLIFGVITQLNSRNRAGLPKKAMPERSTARA